MKKFLILFIFIFYVNSNIAFASDSLPASFVCSSSSNTLLAFNSTNTFEGSFSCSGVPFSLAIHGADTYSLIECDTSLSDCDFSDYDTFISSGASLSSTSYTWSAIPAGTCSSDVVCYHDWLIINLWLIFFLSLISLGLFINFFSKKK